MVCRCMALLYIHIAMRLGLEIKSALCTKYIFVGQGILYIAIHTWFSHKEAIDSQGPANYASIILSIIGD